MARDRNGSLGRNCCGVIIGRRHYTADPLTPCDPPSPVPPRRSTPSHLVARPRAITVQRSCFGFSLIYRGLDKYEEKDTGIFVACVEPGGQAARYGVRENDKILTINAKTPRNVEDIMVVIEQAGAQIKLVVLREEDITIDKTGSLPRSIEINPGRERNGTLGRDGWFGPGVGGHYTASPLIPCDPPSPVPSRRSTRRILVDEAPGGTWHRTASTADISQNECSEDGAIRLHMASNLILLTGSIKEIEIIHTI